MIRQRTVTEYRVISTRDGGIVSEKRYGSMGAVRDRIGRLTSREPWRFYGHEADRQRDGEELVCCLDNGECGCGGDTLRERADRERMALPALVSITVQRRTVTRTAWEEIERPAVPVGVPTRDEGEVSA